MNKTSFFALVKPAALAASSTSGLLPGVSIAQAALESEWGDSKLATECNNYFGLTNIGDAKSKVWQTEEYMTDLEMQREVGNGVIVRIIKTGPANAVGVRRFEVMRRFGAWSTVQANFIARDDLINNALVYVAARIVKRNPIAFMAALCRHWATDPRYFLNLSEIYQQNGYDLLDKQWLNGGSNGGRY